VQIQSHQLCIVGVGCLEKGYEKEEHSAFCTNAMKTYMGWASFHKSRNGLFGFYFLFFYIICIKYHIKKILSIVDTQCYISFRCTAHNTFNFSIHYAM